MGLRDPDTEAGWRGLPSRGELAPVMSLTTAPDISGYGPGPSSRYRPPPGPRPNLGRDPGLVLGSSITETAPVTINYQILSGP